MASTSTEIDVFSDQVIESVKSGNESPLRVYVQLKAMAKASDRILKETKDNCLNEAEKFPGLTFEYMGNRFDKVNVGTSYDYAQCNDPEWSRLNDLINQAKEQMKTRETFLKALNKPLTELDEATGELHTIHPPFVKSEAGLKLTIK